MAIFGTSSKKTEKKAKTARVSHARQRAQVNGAEHEVIRAPWLSEKALLQTEKGVYAFAIPQDATKDDVAGAIKALYKVDAKKIRIVNLPGKTKPMRNKRGFGTRAARRKAYVYLNAGDKIEFA